MLWVTQEITSNLINRRCITPQRDDSALAQVTVSNDGAVFSASPQQTTQGSGSFAWFNFTNTVPNGVLSLDNSTGPFVGGTLVTVTIDNFETISSELVSIHNSIVNERLPYLCPDPNKPDSNQTCLPPAPPYQEPNVTSMYQYPTSRRP